MNIFVVDEHPIAAANQMIDKHVVKMILESGQMLLLLTEFLMVRSGQTTQRTDPSDQAMETLG